MHLKAMHLKKVQQESAARKCSIKAKRQLGLPFCFMTICKKSRKPSLHTVFFAEFINATGSIKNHLFTGVEWV